MASVARFSEQPAPLRGSERARRYAADSPGLTAFRALATIDYSRSLTTLIESEIIPRLLIAHATDAPALPEAIAGACVSAIEIAALAPLALEVEADALLAHVEAILARGVAIDTVLVELLAPAARLLGEYWEEDRCDFVDVTMGLWRLQEVVHEIAARAPAERMLAAGGHRALFASMPGDQHNFGTVVVDELFRRDGWLTVRLSDAGAPELMKCVGDDWFDLVGLTVSCDRHVPSLDRIIGAIRNVSRNPHVCIMVGGRVFSADPDLAALVGADGTARDARLALKVAADLVRIREAHAAAGS